MSQKTNCPLPIRGTRTFKGEFQGCNSGGRGPDAETAQSALTVILKLVLGDLSSVIFLGLSLYSSSSVLGLVCSHFFEATS